MRYLLSILLLSVLACDGRTLTRYEWPEPPPDTALLGYWISGEPNEWRTRVWVELFSIRPDGGLYLQHWQVTPTGRVDYYWSATVEHIFWLARLQASVDLTVDYSTADGPLTGNYAQSYQLDGIPAAAAQWVHRPSGSPVTLWRRWPDADGVLFTWTYGEEEYAITLDLLAGPFLLAA